MVEPALIVGSAHDEHVQAVVAAMGDSSPVVLDAASLEEAEFLLDGNRLALHKADSLQEIGLSGARGWVRRLSPPGWRTGVVAGSREAAIRSSWIALTVGLASHPEVNWLTAYPRLIGAENKLRQAIQAARLGIRVPRTVVANDPHAIPADLGNELVVKPLGVGHFVKSDGDAQSIYLAHVVSLVAPGRDVPVFRADQLEPQKLDGWTGDDFRLLIDEGRRQVDRQQSDLENIRGRAQWLFTVGAAALAALGGGYVSTHPASGVAVLWLAGMVLLVYGVGGAAAILTVKADFKVIHAAVLSASTPPVDQALASSYARMMSTGENTVATRLTVFRQAVVFSLIGGYLSLLAVLVAG